MLKEEFQKATLEVNSLTTRPSNEDLLQLYSFYKQATDGDITGEKPSGFDFKAIAKYSTWEKLKGMGAEEAMQKYIALVSQLKEKLS
ncbi:MAG TPA: acyl-CoA-binding protein [Cyclobacteriaceae bacterium]